MIKRTLSEQLLKTLKTGKSVLILGARQTGKTTLIKQLPAQLYLNLMNPNTRQIYERHPGQLITEIAALRQTLSKPSLPLIIIDEIQKVPQLMDSIQVLIDDTMAQFVLTGSSPRQLKNLLPGRVIRLQMDPITRIEHPLPIENILQFGSLPGIISLSDTQQKELELKSYVETYLEEEVRKEGLVRQLGPFSKFLHLASIESGHHLNLSRLSQDIGVAHTTISGYYSILESCMLAERFEPITESSSRRKLLKSVKYILFDFGVRRICAQEGFPYSIAQTAHLFEQWVGLELRRLIRQEQKLASVHFWRDHNGPEVDWILKSEKKHIPIEVKWTQNPSEKDCRHLKTFMAEYESTNGYVICKCQRPMLLAPNILALNWQDLPTILSSIS